MSDPVKVDGLNEFVRSLKKIDADLPKAVRLALNEAVDAVIDLAVPKIPRRSGRAAGSVKAASTRTTGRVKAGNKRVPYYPWLDFGGKVGRNRSISRPFKKQGRYIYPAYNKLKESGEFQDVLTEALAKVAKQAGITVES